jgi:hypothetical protein
MTPKDTSLAISLICLIWGSTALASEDGDWQLAMIHQPSAAQLKVEQRGRVYIYDRLDDADVELAMNTQFGRLDRMMFVRTQVPTSEGETETADDGCD